MVWVFTHLKLLQLLKFDEGASHCFKIDIAYLFSIKRFFQTFPWGAWDPGDGCACVVFSILIPLFRSEYTRLFIYRLCFNVQIDLFILFGPIQAVLQPRYLWQNVVSTTPCCQFLAVFLAVPIKYYDMVFRLNFPWFSIEWLKPRLRHLRSQPLISFDLIAWFLIWLNWSYSAVGPWCQVFIWTLLVIRWWILPAWNLWWDERCSRGHI